MLQLSEGCLRTITKALNLWLIGHGSDVGRRHLVLYVVCALAMLGCRSPKTAADIELERLRRDPRPFVQELASIRGLTDARPTRVVFDEEEAFRRALYTKAKKDGIGPSDADSPLFFAAFEFPPPNAQEGASQEEVYEEQIVAFYDEHTHSIHVRESSFQEKDAAEVISVLAHEFGHSLQTQHLPFPNLAHITAEDARLAHNAVLEGDAMLLMVAHLAHRARIPTSRALVKIADAAAHEEFDDYAEASNQDAVLSRAPALVRERLEFPYVQGMVFLGAIYRAGGFPLVNRVYSRPPTTTEQVLHPQKYLDGEGAVPIADIAVPRGFKKLLVGAVGELQMRVILGFCMEPERAASAAAGWGGDRYMVLAHQGGTGALLWSTVWDSELEAQEFEAALRHYVTCSRQRTGVRVMPLDDTVVRHGDRVALIRGIAKASSLPIAKQLVTAVGQAPAALPAFGAIRIPPVRRPAAFRPPHLSRSTYVNEQLGLTLGVPPHFKHEMPDPTTLILSRQASSPVVLGMTLSEQIASQSTVDEVHSELAAALRGALDGAQLDYVSGHDVNVGPLGVGIERYWKVRGSDAGLRAIVVPICRGTGSLVLWGLWADANGLANLDWWLGTVRRLSPDAPPICAELNP